MYFARFEGFVFVPVDDDPLSGTLPAGGPARLIHPKADRRRREVGLHGRRGAAEPARDLGDRDPFGVAVVAGERCGASALGDAASCAALAALMDA